ncbi:MAG: uroporphyrinogen decarboxylase [Sphingobium sp.]|nr:uroporphyrinogen decarboxylase [Sphingobium sp.]MBP6111382.1 uroporphyrinogen decarboxylase [Sphingobium sp.]MBP8670873.1 uroporphyrinogen decarboxylase [Sphingobium sp.]MBP9156700.1 uroporphyrinogen decarboxylase [Sphingobium sp.]MCC6481546.1 uroporphyrinogen decarboxylase [Sphingomonadaceae bacterium]
MSGTPEKVLLAVLKGQRHSMAPRWMMRQAGRYLPEYRALRADKGGFLALVYDSAAAAEITLQPLRRFGTGREGLHAAILFSDILIVPYAMGQNLWFEAGEGPRLAPTLLESELDALTPDFSRYEAIYETVRQVKAQLDPETTFLGFAGSPWTIATYMVAGQGSKDQGAARRMAYADTARFATIIDAIVEATVPYLIGQIDAGVDAVQLFDSWAGSLSPQQFARWVIAPNRAIVEKVRSARPGVPIIGFPKGAGAKLVDYARETGVDALGLDETIDPVWADTVLPKGLPVQGNLDPLVLIAGGDALDSAIDTILAAFQNRPHIFNLGHGITPETPIAHVEQMLKRLGREG